MSADSPVPAITDEIVEAAARSIARRKGDRSQNWRACEYKSLDEYVDAVWPSCRTPDLCAALEAVAPLMIAKGLREACNMLDMEFVGKSIVGILKRARELEEQKP